jgi:hypothetical protein
MTDQLASVVFRGLFYIILFTDIVLDWGIDFLGGQFRGHGESAALPLPLLQIATVTLGLPQHSFCYSAGSHCRCAAAAMSKNFQT